MYYQRSKINTMLLCRLICSCGPLILYRAQKQDRNYKEQTDRDSLDFGFNDRSSVALNGSLNEWQCIEETHIHGLFDNDSLQEEVA